MTDASAVTSTMVTVRKRNAVVSSISSVKVNFGFLSLVSVLFGIALTFAAVYVMILNMCLGVSCEPISLGAQVANYGLLGSAVVFLGASAVLAVISFVKSDGHIFALPAFSAFVGFICFIMWA